MIQIFKKKPTIIHSCTQKSASQWFISFLNDVVNQNSGYKFKSFTTFRKEDILGKTRFIEPTYELQKLLYTDVPKIGIKKLSKGIVYSSFYVGPSILEQTPENSKVFFVLRDPRDIVFSWYNSSKFSHAESPNIIRVRKILNELSYEEGIKFSINELNSFGLFEGINNWLDIDNNDQVKVFLYEDLSNQYEKFCYSILDFLDIKIERNELESLLHKHSFSNYSGGRKNGEEDISSHYRSGIVGEWREKFTDELLDVFSKETNSLDKKYERLKSKFLIR